MVLIRDHNCFSIWFEGVSCLSSYDYGVRMAQSNNVTPLFKSIQVDKIAVDEHVACEDCSLFRLCLPVGLKNNELVQLDSIINRSQSYARGASLFSLNLDFNSLFVVRSGSFKTYIQGRSGREQVTGFYFPGEIIGLDALHGMAYRSSATAMESSSVCELPYASMQELGGQIPRLQVHLLNRLSKELCSDKSLMRLLGKKNADEKMATFLLSLSARFQERGFSATEFSLTMSRADIANHLGLAVETISRLFTRLQKDDLILVSGKKIVLRDMERLQNLCEE